MHEDKKKKNLFRDNNENLFRKGENYFIKDKVKQEMKQDETDKLTVKEEVKDEQNKNGDKE
jgi:hypothetical protein